ncbi:MAG: T9SS type A sorting domain-containing protein [Gelidibacter sp.]
MRKITFLFTLLIAVLGFNGFAQDTCGTAVAVTSGTVNTTTIVDGSGGAEMGVLDGAADSAWYSYTPASDGTILVSACNGGSDTNLNIGTGTCGALTIVASNDDSCDLGDGNAYASEVGAIVTGGTTYYIEWDDKWEDSIAFNWTLTFTPPPSNDECAGAIPVACDDTVMGSTATATDSGGNSNAANDLWYSFTGMGVAQDVTVSLCNSSYDTAVRVYTDCSLTAGAQVLFNDDSCGTNGTRSAGTFSSDGVSTYYILVEGYSIANGSFEMSISCADNVPAPPNDLCSNAIELTLNTVTSGTTAGATDSSTGNIDDTTCPSFTFKSDVWYYFTAPDTDVSIVTTVTGTSDQANVAVYSSIDCTQLDNDILPGACQSGNGGESFNLTGLTMDNVYYIRVWSDGVAPRSSGARTEGTFNIIVNDATLSTDEFENANAFTYFPNPVRNELTLKAQSTIQNVSIYNMLGQEVLKTTPMSLESNVNMNPLQSGAYFVKVTINDSTETIRVIKQ